MGINQYIFDQPFVKWASIHRKTVGEIKWLNFNVLAGYVLL